MPPRTCTSYAPYRVPTPGSPTSGPSSPASAREPRGRWSPRTGGWSRSATAPASPRWGAEAGTWTSPPYRGRGYAAATTSAWADQLPGIHLFYSTSADNHSSQRVARRLALRPLGRLWHLTA
ncbi:GNAT family N-acetyltransferase [Nonomuraea rubra]|uniref:GNAT family N-acetyltransferase n=1 Tax=Nonomuraea rubra TaxID=46180 RepID=UPI003CD0BE37